MNPTSSTPETLFTALEVVTKEMVSNQEAIGGEAARLYAKIAELQKATTALQAMSDPAVRRTYTLNQRAFEKLSSGQIKIQNNLNQQKEPIPPLGSPTMTPEVRHRKLHSLFCNPGCSLLIDLFADLIDTYLNACKKNSVPYMQMLIQFKTVDGSNPRMTFERVLMDYMANIHIQLGNLLILRVREDSLFNSMVTDPGFKPTYVRDQVEKGLDQARTAIDVALEVTQSSALKNSFQKLFDLIELLREVLRQDMGALYRPLLLNDQTLPEISPSHFQRLYLRIQRIYKLVSEFESLVPSNIQFKNTEIQDLFNKDRKTVLPQIAELEKALRILSKADNKLESQQLLSFYNLLVRLFKEDRKELQLSGAYGLLVSQLGNYPDVDSLPPNQKGLISINIICMSLWLPYKSVLHESLLIFLNYINQFDAVFLENLYRELDFCISNFNYYIKYNNKHFEAKSTKAASLSLEGEQEKRMLSHLQQSALQHQKFFEQIFNPLVESLKMRMDLCTNSPQASFHQLLALRDLLMMAKVNFPSNKELGDTFNIAEKYILGIDRLPHELQDLYDTLVNSTDMLAEMAQATVTWIDDHLRQAFEKTAAKSIESAKLTASALAAKAAAADDEMLKLIEEEEAAKAKKGAAVKPKNSKAKGSKAKAKKREAVSSPAPVAKPSAKAAVRKVVQAELPAAFVPPSPLSSLGNLEKWVESLNGLSCTGPDSDFRQVWLDGSLSNLEDFLRQLRETEHDGFSLNKIFGETDTLRRLLEAAMETVIAYYPLVDEQNQSLLRQTYAQGHQLHLHVQLLVKSGSYLPKNVFNALWSLRAIPYALSQGNLCVNYLARAADDSHLSPQGQRLAEFLRHVEQVAEREDGADSREASLLLENHLSRMKEGQYFADELLHALLDPTHELDSSLFPQAVFSPTLKSRHDEEFLAFLGSPSVPEELSPITLKEGEGDDLSVKPPRDKESAIFAIETTLMWIKIRKMAPVQGRLDSLRRKTRRDHCLDNLTTYLTWLREKFETIPPHKPYNRLSEELRLMRRAHKELSLAALWHGEYYPRQQHIVDEKHLQAQNNPCLLNAILRSHSAAYTKLPNLDRPPFTWLRGAHAALSYPTPLVHRRDKKLEPIETLALRSVLQDIRRTLKEKQDVTPLVLSQEAEKVFTSLSALTHILRYGIPLLKSDN